jgi:hypothetical protein
MWYRDNAGNIKRRLQAIGGGSGHDVNATGSTSNQQKRRLIQCDNKVRSMILPTLSEPPKAKKLMTWAPSGD